LSPDASGVFHLRMVAATKTRRKTLAKTAKLPPRTFRLGYAAGVIRVKVGVDLTQPTAPGKKVA
jgi:hypothetical protein